MEKFLNKVVRVDWRDAHHMVNDWVDQDTLEFPDTRITSVGKLVKTDDHHLMLAQSFCGDTTVAGTFIITKAQVFNIKELK